MNEQTTILLQKLSESLSKGINWLWEKAKEDRPDADCFKEEREEG